MRFHIVSSRSLGLQSFATSRCWQRLDCLPKTLTLIKVSRFQRACACTYFPASSRPAATICMQLVTNLFPLLLLICLPSFFPVTLPPPVILPSPSLAAVIIVSACACISFSTLKATADNEVVITRPPPSATSNSSATSVIIFGWGGARRRHLRRLEEWSQPPHVTLTLLVII
jgi:hypothetical protein